MKKAIVALLLMALLLPVAICEVTYTQISQEEATQIMDEETDYIIVDVRTQEEYDEAHIPGAINIANEDIGADENTELPNKDQMLLVYCRSGRRSKEAAAKLAALGYTNVYEFGGIMTWTGKTISTADEELIFDDPFEAHEYGSPEDFYEDYGDNFDDFEEAEEYYYEHGGW
ncbi:MAG: rhodanese-like domain-containing protein [Clostridiales bacterium]|nr:rhodanese-like domain-containing protein [Clostridiales bacterium]